MIVYGGWLLVVEKVERLLDQLIVLTCLASSLIRKSGELRNSLHRK